jgi:hypothetical protein
LLQQVEEAAPDHRWKGTDFGRLPSFAPYPSFSDAPPSVSLDRHCAPKLKESDKNKATGLVPLVPTDAFKKLPNGASRLCHINALCAFPLVDKLVLKLLGVFILIIFNFLC